MLAKSGNDTFALCLYADEQVASHHKNVAAEVGYVGVRNMVKFSIDQTSPIETVLYTLPGSQSCSMLHITSRSNINVPGVFVFLLEHGIEPYFGTDIRNVDHEFQITLHELQCQRVKREMSVWFQWAMSMEVVEWRCVWIESGG